MRWAYLVLLVGGLMALSDDDVTQVFDYMGRKQPINRKSIALTQAGGGLASGHLKGDATDLLWNGRDFTRFSTPRVDSQNTHGTGCTFSAAIVAGLATFGAYILVLAALSRASAASVAAVRETSVVIATVLAVPILHERVGPARLAGAVLVVVGVAFLVY